jgi:hypothetical protein
MFGLSDVQRKTRRNASPVSLNCCMSKSASPELDLFLKEYFERWSAKDLVRFAECFHDQATCHSIVDGVVAFHGTKDDLIRRQAKYFESVQDSISEKMLSFSAEEDDCTALVTARWEFEGAGQRFIGIDRFTLLRGSDHKWKVLHLAWYSEK